MQLDVMRFRSLCLMFIGSPLLALACNDNAPTYPPIIIYETSGGGTAVGIDGLSGSGGSSGGGSGNDAGGGEAGSQ